MVSIPHSQTPQEPNLQPNLDSVDQPYGHLSDFDLLRLFCKALHDNDFIGDIESKVNEMKHDTFHKVDMTPEFDLLTQALDEATYRVWLHDHEAERRRRLEAADQAQEAGGA